jgi:tetratricopeptide (TPR) repeat protein
MKIFFSVSITPQTFQAYRFKVILAITLICFIHYNTIAQDYHEIDKVLNKALTELKDGLFDNALSNYKEVENQLKDKYANDKNLTEKYIESLIGIGNVYNAKDSFDLALLYYNKSIQIAKEKLTPDNLKLGRALLAKAGTLLEQNDFRQALEYYKNAEIIFVQNNEYTYLIRTYRGMGRLYDKIDDIENSSNCYLKAISITETNLGENHPAIIQCYRGLGAIEYKKGHYETAYSYFKQAMEIGEKILGLKTSTVADTYEDFGTINWKLNKNDSALYYLKKAGQIYLNIYGEKSNDMAALYYNIALVYRSLEEYDTALYYHNKDLTISMYILGPEHSNIAESYENMGVIYYLKGEYSLSLEYLNKSLIIFQKIYGLENSEIADVYYNFGLVYEALNKRKYAKSNYRKAFEIYRRAFGDNHPLTKQAKENL